MQFTVLLLAVATASALAAEPQSTPIGLNLPLSKTPIRSTVIRLNGIKIPDDVKTQIQGTYYFVNGTVGAKPPRIERWCSIPADDLQGVSRLSGDYQVVGRFNVGGWSSTTRLILKSLTGSAPSLIRVSCQLGPLHLGQRLDAASFLYQLGGGTFYTQFSAYLYSSQERTDDPVRSEYLPLNSAQTRQREACLELTQTALTAEGLALSPQDLWWIRPFCQPVATPELRSSMVRSPRANPNCAQAHHLCEQNFPLGLPNGASFVDQKTTSSVEQQRIYYVQPTILWR